MLILSAAVARGTFVLCEYDASTGADDLTEISRKVLPKIPRTGAIRSYVYGGHTFNYLLDKDLIFLCIAAPTATELVFEFLNEFRRTFEAVSRRSNREVELARMLRDLIMRYNMENGGGRVEQVERDLEEVTDVMRNNLGKVIERGERIDSLLDKTSALKAESVSFRSSAKRYNDDLWWRDQRGKMFLGIVAMAAIVILTWFMLRPEKPPDGS
ncbi:unnamed protein product [Durusdinium trenchii]|uniref:Vesicle-associated membrane protein 7 n=2 Tax=Durusdinium trenchii TaxID=1381693 RepID=A0ABP0KAK6_9DINO